MILGLTGSRSGIVCKPLPSDDPSKRSRTSQKRRSLLGWEPKVSLTDGLKETIGYFRNLLN